MHKLKTLAAGVLAMAGLSGCAENKTYEMGSYGYDKEFFSKNGIEIIELTDSEGKAGILISPGYQGRVMTTTADGRNGDSYGWINYKLIESKVIDPQFNPVGGEERFWLGPEGGPFSLYFKPGEEQVYKNWVVPSVIDTERFDIEAKSNKSVKFTKQASITNASGTTFDMNIERTISLIAPSAIASLIGTKISGPAKIVGYTTDNIVTNTGNQAWIKENGLVSIWLLCMFNPTATTTVFIPYEQDAEGTIVNDDYFGKVPADRLIADNGTVYFKIDGTYRSKIGLPAGRATEFCGSYDSDKKVLTILTYNLPEGDHDYVNSKWGDQEDPFNGDVINAYNDGPTDEGNIMGPFYEIETSSPGAKLSPGQSIRHVQSVVHIQADDDVIAPIVKTVFGLDLNSIAAKF